MPRYLLCHYRKDSLPPPDSFYMIDSDSKFWNRAPEILPLTVRAAGHYRMHRNDWQYKVRSRPINQLFWIADGKLSFERNGRKYLCNEGAVFVYYPNEPHIINAVSEVVELYWLTLHGTLADELFRKFEFPDTSTRCGKCPAHLFETLMDQIYHDASPCGLATAASTAMMIMNFAKTGIPDEYLQDHLIQQAVIFIENNFTDPQLNINLLAETLKINRSVLSRNFSRQMNMSPLAYLMLTRIHYASELLRTTTLPVSVISKRAGFANQISFIRAFKQHFGQTPGGFRTGESRR
ncbi:MAG: AraC family transcriptional regulator [Lentisphaerae bacterium]|nr:AraC family transcriptional regulator [Lentisphaerota bacterium]